MEGQECLLVKTASEIALKSDFVRKFFTKKLVQGIKLALKRNNIAFKSIARGGGRLYIFCESPKKAQIALSRVPGIHATAIATQFRQAEYPGIEAATVNLARGFLKKGDSFALDARVAGNRGLGGKDLENRLGKAIMDAIPGLKVNLSSPEKKVFIEATKNGFFIFTAQDPGLGGLPMGVEGNAAMSFSGKKEELLAAFLLMHRGCNVFPVVRKKTNAIEEHIQKLVPFNSYRKFAITEENKLPELVAERGIQAIATADSKTDEKSLAGYRQFDASQELAVLRPLLLYPKEYRKKLQKLFH